jgi:hypothetical protein
MKVRVFPDALIVILALLGALSLIDESWRAPTPLPLVQFLQGHDLWRIWNALRWQQCICMRFFISCPAWSALWWDARFTLQSKGKEMTPNDGLRVSCRPSGHTPFWIDSGLPCNELERARFSASMGRHI